MSAIVQGERLLSNRTRAGADPALRALKCDAALRVELQHPHMDRVPRYLRQGARFTRRGARHVLAGDTGAGGRIDVGRAGRQATAACGRLENRMHGADVDAVAATRARRHERHFRRRAGWAKPALGRDALFRALRDLVEKLAKGILEKRAPLVQKLGSRLTCQRNRTRLSVPSAA